MAIAFEILGFAAFGLVLAREIRRKDARTVLEIIAAAVFGILLEVLNSNLTGNYYYNGGFIVKIFSVPVAIGLGWAVIIYACMKLTDAYAVSWKKKPFFDAFNALILDLSMDMVAIRMGLWSWKLEFDEEWFGVPYDNLFGWFAVVLSFSLVVRFLRHAKIKKLYSGILLALSPLVSYAFLSAQMAIFFLLVVLPLRIGGRWPYFRELYNKEGIGIIYLPEIRAWKTILFLGLFVFCAYFIWASFSKKKAEKKDIFSFWLLTAIYLFFLSAIFIYSMYAAYPLLAVVSIAAICVHLGMNFQYLKYR